MPTIFGCTLVLYALFRNIASIEERRVINEADVDEMPEKEGPFLPFCKVDPVNIQVSNNLVKQGI